MTQNGEAPPPAEEHDKRPSSADTPEEDDESLPEPVAAPPETEGEHEGKQFRATVREIERVPSSAVPEDYPVPIATAEAIAMELTVEGTEEPIFVIYFETPDRGPDTRLGQLLTAVGDADGAVDRLDGRSLLLTIEDGYYLPVVPDGNPRGNGNAVYGIFAGLVPSIVVVLVGLFSPGASFIGTTPFVVGWLVATFVLLPVSVYVDALHLRTTTNWTGEPRNWAILAAVPGLNVAAIPLYLIARENAEPFV